MTTTTVLESGRIAVPGAVSFAAATGATWIVRGLARRFGIVNKPNPLVPQHTKPVAYLGGVGLGVGAAAGITAMFIGWRADLDAIGLTLVSLGSPAFLYLVLGMVDDLIAFQPARKFMLQTAVAILAVVLGVWAPMTGVEAIDRGLSWFWIMTLVNAFNLTDVCDGLLGSLSAVMFGIVSLAFPPLAPMGVVLIAGCCGFLVFNKPPATIFLGDAGSHLLGFMAAALTLAGLKLTNAGPISGSIVAILMMGVPLFELTFLVIVRTRKGLAWWRGSPDHFSLRMQAGGLSRLQTDLIACSVAALWGVAALGMLRVGTWGQVAIIAGVLALAIIAARLLLRWEVKPKSPVNPTPSQPEIEALSPG